MLVIIPNKRHVAPFITSHININNCEEYCVPNITLFIIARFHFLSFFFLPNYNRDLEHIPYLIQPLATYKLKNKA